MTAYYHGGPPGLTSVRPRQETGARAAVEFADFRRFLFPGYRVYLTQQRRMAEFHAAFWAVRSRQRLGWVYAVRPGADLDVDLDEPAAWTCDSAEVTAVAGTVQAWQLRALAAWHRSWAPRQPARLASAEERLRFFDRAVERAVRHGHDRTAVLAELDAAARRNAEARP